MRPSLMLTSVTVCLSRRSTLRPTGNRISVSTSYFQRLKSTTALDTTRTSKVTEKYVRKTPLEHVKLRPGMYIGSTTAVTEERWVYHWGLHHMVHKEVQFVPGLVKLFDEILVNASDNATRCNRTSEIRVSIDPVESVSPETGLKVNNARFTVWNNGSSVPVELHEKENMYVPELVFGHLHTGSNFSDASDSFTGGRHGFGAKLTNIFSDEFTIETRDRVRGLTFKQTWNGMVPNSPPVILTPNTTAADSYSLPSESFSEEFTKISFVPNLEVFGTRTLSRGTLSVIKSRVIDLAGTVGRDVNVFLNDDLIRLRSGDTSQFTSYATLYLGNSRRDKTFTEDGEVPDITNSVCYAQPSELVEVVVACSPEPKTPIQVSFVNNMATTRGGSHVELLRKQIAQFVVEEMNRKARNKDAKATMKVVSNELALFVNAKVANPSFDSQMKECLTTEPSKIRKHVTLSSVQLNQIVKTTGIIERVKQVLSSKDEKVLHRVGGKGASGKRRLQIPKLEDANLAGSKDSSKCTLILTEGDSAKALAVAGIAEVGRDYYGVFPLRGKPLNVRESSAKQISMNEEILNLTKIVGLDFKNRYAVSDDEPLKLRYGRIMLMTDQDYDGSHIKGLLINLFDYFWPALLQRKGFLCEFVTPVIKARPSALGKKSKSSDDVDEISFYSVREYDQWRATQDDLSQWTIKYYKGLGTSTSAEAREYFQNLARHTIEFTDDPAEGKAGSAQIDMCFNKDMSQQRKEWITTSLLNTDIYFDHSRDEMTYDEFINQELVLYSQYDNMRSIPSVVDGLKPSQRKILYAALRKFKTQSSEMKVAQLSGVVSELAAYHHGEASLHSTIIGMAQDFVGSNNLPLLYPSGQFGTRIQGGKDAASARYTFTRLQDYTRLLFPKEDDVLLEYNEDDGLQVEPKYFVPIIPLVLVNGTNGIGFGWSSQVHPRNPLDVIESVREYIEKAQNCGDETEIQVSEPLPWYNGFEGQLIHEGGVSSTSVGVATYDAKKHLVTISELPIGKWVNDYRKLLGGDRWANVIDDFNEYHTEKSVHFEIRVKRSARKRIKELAAKGKLERYFSLESKVSHTNMHLFDSDYRIKLYSSANEIIRDFYPIRENLYVDRKQYMLAELGRRMGVLKGKIQFAKFVQDGKIELVGSDLEQLGATFRELNLEPMSVIEARYPLPDLVVEPDLEDSIGSVVQREYRHLLNRPIWHLSADKVASQEAKYAALEDETSALENKTSAELWMEDLAMLEQRLRALGFSKSDN